MSAQVSSFENLRLPDLQSFVIESGKDLQRYMEAKGQTPDQTEIQIIRSKRQELEAASKRLVELREIDETYKKTVEEVKGNGIATHPVPFETGQQGQAQMPQSVKTLGQMFTESTTYKSYCGIHNESSVYDIRLDDADLKTVMTTAAGAALTPVRDSLVVPYAVRQPMLTDIIPITPTTDGSIDYLEETTALAGTNAQVAVAENTAKFENALAFTIRNVKPNKVATYLPVSDEQLDDVPGMRSIIDNRLTEFLKRKEEDLLLTGNGTPPEMTGFLVKSGVNALARTTESNIEMVWKLIQLCRTVGFAEPDAIVMHPTNFDPVVLYQDTGGTFQFNPLTENGGVTRLFGKTLILSTGITLNTTLVGSFRLFSEIRRRLGLSIRVGYNTTDFVTNRKTILAEFREALLIYRAAAFAKGTNMQ